MVGMQSGHTLINYCTVKELKMTKQSSCIINPLESQNRLYLKE